MNILALDLGTQMGWALGTRDGKIQSGSESFGAGRHDGPGQRWLKFRAFITAQARAVGEVHAVYYEDVKRHGPGQVIAAHVYGGFLAHLQTWCELNNIRLVPVGVGSIKKHWTGMGNAKKLDMLAEARRRGFAPVDDNHADALAILSLARLIEAGEYSAPAKSKKKKVAKKVPIATAQPQPGLFAEAE